MTVTPTISGSGADEIAAVLWSAEVRPQAVDSATIALVERSFDSAIIEASTFDAAADHDVYIHTESMLGDPVANGTLAVAAADLSEAVPITGLNSSTQYFVQVVSDISGTVTLSNEINFTTGLASLDEILNRIHDILHRSGESVAAPTNLHLGLLVATDNAGDLLIEKAAEDNYGRIPYAQAAPTDGEAANPSDYVFPDPTSSYDVIGVFVGEGSTVGAGRIWGHLLYAAPVTITSGNRTISAGNFVSVGVMIGNAEIS
jgi:hypothetical protein